MTDKKETKTCPICGQLFTAYKFRHQRFCSRSCSRTGRTGESNNNWKGGQTVHKQSGRLLVKTDRGYELEHRVVAREQLGRELLADEVVHHINGDFTDNRPENLQVMQRSEHIGLHNPARWASRQEVPRDEHGRFREAA